MTPVLTGKVSRGSGGAAALDWVRGTAEGDSTGRDRPQAVAGSTASHSLQ